MIFWLYLLVAPFLIFNLDTITGYLGKFFGRVFFKTGAQSPYWSVVTVVKRRRLIILGLLIFLVLGSAVGIIYFLWQGAVKHRVWIDLTQLHGLVLTIGILALIFLLCRRSTGSPASPDQENDHSLAKLKDTVDTLSITAGLKPPSVHLWAHSTPSLFLFTPISNTPILYATTSFFYNFDQVEIEAAVAHQLAKIQTGQVRHRVISRLLTVAAELGSLLLFPVLLFFLDPDLITYWAILHVFVAIIFISLLLDTRDSFRIRSLIPVKDQTDLPVAILMFMNPFYFILAFIVNTLYNLGQFGELIYADLKALELTRFPEGLYSALTKMETILTRSKSLPAEYTPLLFIPEAGGANASFIRAEIKERKAVLTRIEPGLTESHNGLKELICSRCDQVMEEITLIGHYHTREQGKICKRCGALWLEDKAFYRTSNSLSIEIIKNLIDQITESKPMIGSYNCPRCFIELSEEKDPTFTDQLKIKVYQCRSCRGHLISATDFSKYIYFRLNLKGV